VVLPGYLRTPRSAGPPLDPATRGFLAAGDPPLLVTLGSTPVADPARVTRILAAATGELGLRMILQRGVAGLGAGCDPDRVHLADTLPYDRVLDRVAGVVHHAGSGTLAEVLTHGRPSLALPGFADQYLWAHRIPAIGAGPAPLPLPRLDRAALTRRLRELTGEPRYRRRAAEIAVGLRHEDGPTRAAAAIGGFLSGR
jgi:UDP:flavonoid glycosyltransferase YjiC (YdhE family)